MSGARATSRLRAVAWPEPDRAYAVGDEGAMCTWRRATDLWEPDPGAPPNLRRGNFTGIAFDPSDPSRGYAVGKQGLLLGYGRSWTQESLPEGVDPEADFTSILDNNPSPRFGIVLRYQGQQSYYLFSRLAGGTTGLRISRIANGVETILKHVSAPNPSPGVAFRLKGSVRGNLLTLELDGALKVSTTDPNATFPGSVGLYLAIGSGSGRSYAADNFAATAE